MPRSLLKHALSSPGSQSQDGNRRILDALLAVLSPIQKKFLLDPSRYKLARCSRRAGKSYVDAVYLIYVCHLARSTPVLYAGLTRDSAKEAIWPILIALLDELSIPYKAKESALTVEFPNGSKITIFGCDTQNAKNRLRGRKFKLVIFDETGFFAALDGIIHAVLPMLADYAGTLVLTSSPGELLAGFFYDADQGKTKDKWARYSWTIYDNPFFQQPAIDAKYKTRADEEIATVLELQFNSDPTLPGFKREWLGEWVADATSLIYPVSAQNLFHDLKALPYAQRVIGIGFGPLASVVVVAEYSDYAREFLIVDQWSRDDLELDHFFKQLDYEVERYHPNFIVAYLGNYSASVTDELKRRYKLPIVPMKDDDIAFHQRVFSQDLQNGYIQIKEGLPLLAEYGKIVKDSDGDEIPGQSNHGSNVALVTYRKVYQTTLSAYVPPPSEEDWMIQRLEASQYEEETPWYERA